MEKIEIARRELGAALQLFIEDKCPVSVHVLASAGAEVIEGLVQHSGGKPLLDMVLAANPQYTKKEVNDALRKFELPCLTCGVQSSTFNRILYKIGYSGTTLN